MRISVAFVLAAFLLTPQAHSQQRPSEDQIIEAFLECPEIIDAQKALAPKAQLGTPWIALENMLCGAVGCQFATLVIQPYERKGVNPSAGHLFGFVHVGPNGDITLVERVVLVPARDLGTPGNTGKERHGG